MDMNSPDSKKNWGDLVARARQIPAPTDFDVRQAIREQIAAQATRPVARAGLLDELLDLGHARWLQTGLAGVMAFAAWSCWQSVTVVSELSALWSLGGPLMAQL
jgi:hypothetical protein